MGRLKGVEERGRGMGAGDHKRCENRTGILKGQNYKDGL